jgi:hypothetical protein
MACDDTLESDFSTNDFRINEWAQLQDILMVFSNGDVHGFKYIDRILLLIQLFTCVTAYDGIAGPHNYSLRVCDGIAGELRQCP